MHTFSSTVEAAFERERYCERETREKDTHGEGHTHGGGGGGGGGKESIDVIVQCRYLCHAVANMGALEAAALEFVRLGVQDSLSSLLDRSPS